MNPPSAKSSIKKYCVTFIFLPATPFITQSTHSVDWYDFASKRSPTRSEPRELPELSTQQRNTSAFKKQIFCLSAGRFLLYHGQLGSWVVGYVNPWPGSLTTRRFLKLNVYFLQSQFCKDCSTHTHLPFSSIQTLAVK